MSDQPSDSCTAGVILTQNLAQENPQRDQRRIDSIQKTRLDVCQCFRNRLLREDVAKRQISVLQKLMSQESELLLKSSVMKITHRRGRLAGDGFMTDCIL
jgi:hypothetical protein